MAENIRTVGLVGLGGIGAFVAPRLKALLGNDFSVVAGGARKERLREGVLINGDRHYFNLCEPADLVPVDLVIFATKNMQLDQAICDAGNMIGQGTIVLSLLNGIDSEERLAAAFPQAYVLKSLIKVPASHENGAIIVPMDQGKISFGQANNAVLVPAVSAVQGLFEAAGIPYDIPKDMDRDIWFKFMCNVSENQLAAVLKLSYGDFQTISPAEHLRQAVCREVIEVAAARGINLTEEDLLARGRYIQTLRADGKPSTLQDMEAGRLTEVESFSGRILQLAAAAKIQTPLCEFLYYAIKTLEQMQNNR